MPTSSLACWTPVTASLSALPGAMSKEMVTAGTWPEWLMLSGMVPVADLGHRRQRHQVPPVPGR